jgi:hypothetical protein
LLSNGKTSYLLTISEAISWHSPKVTMSQDVVTRFVSAYPKHDQDHHEDDHDCDGSPLVGFPVPL